MIGLAVIDASAVVALFADSSELGDWAAATASGRRLGAPWLMPYEACNSLRRRERAGQIDAASAARACADILSMRVELWPHRQTTERAWELRGAVTYYDASYVALAESLGAPLITLDRKLTRAPGSRCTFLTPPDGL